MGYYIKMIGEKLFLGGSDDGRLIIVDARKQEEKKYFSPMEMLLLAAAGCTAIDVSHTLKKMRQDVRELVVEVDGERRDEYPRIYKKVGLVYKIKGVNIDKKKAERAVEMSLSKYCSASITLKKAGADLTYKIEIENVIDCQD